MYTLLGFFVVIGINLGFVEVASGIWKRGGNTNAPQQRRPKK